VRIKNIILLINPLTGKCWEVKRDKGIVAKDESRFEETELKSFFPFSQGHFSRSDWRALEESRLQVVACWSWFYDLRTELKAARFSHFLLTI
jgi:hypothetical protein